MIKFKQKEFSESDAMRPFYVKLQKEVKERRAPFVQVIGKSEMIPILSGNNVIIEKFKDDKRDINIISKEIEIIANYFGYQNYFNSIISSTNQLQPNKNNYIFNEIH